MTLEILFYRPCKRCERGFFYCRSREPGRRYCCDCATPAKKERERRARKRYRRSPEGLEQHRDQEAERRERQQLERVGDRRFEQATDRVQVLAPTAPYARAEKGPSDAPTSQPPPIQPRSVEPLEWLLVAWPELLAAATQLLGSLVACPRCGRRGVVVRVVPLDGWDEEDER